MAGEHVGRRQKAALQEVRATSRWGYNGPKGATETVGEGGKGGGEKKEGSLAVDQTRVTWLLQRKRHSGP